jgi:amidase
MHPAWVDCLYCSGRHPSNVSLEMSFTTTELWRLSATELAEAIRSKQASSQEVIEAHLRRIEDVNPSINAVTVVLGEQAVEAAKAADRAVARGGDLPPFHGVPFTVKGNIDLAGTPTTQGARALAGAYPTLDAPQVERVKAAGAIPIGRTNLPTFAVRWHCDSELWGATVNPWDRSRTPGASSGGEAAALATGMSPLGLGNDGLGSLRWPAQCCGVTALKPTLGRIPHAGTIQPVDAPISVQLTSVEGAMARRIADLRAAFEVMAGPTWRDPWTVPAPLRGLAPAKPIRVALVVDPAGLGTAKQVQEGVRKAARALVDAGYAVDEVEPPSIEAAAKTLLDMLNTPDIRAGWQLMAPAMPADTKRFMSAFFEVAGDPGPMTTMQSFVIRQSLLRAWGEFQEEHPLIVAPIYTDIPFEAGKDLTTAEVSAIIRGMRMAIAVNALGLPAVALPVGIGDGLPQAVQVIGPRYREDLCGFSTRRSRLSNAGWTSSSRWRTRSSARSSKASFARSRPCASRCRAEAILYEPATVDVRHGARPP